jgi:hypothetical protein
MSRSFLVLPLVFAAALAAGCVSAPPIMVAVRPPQPMQARPDAALVVFIRPSAYAWAVTADVMDETGHFVGRMVPRGNFAVQMAPGRHLFIIWAENTDVLQADLLPGHIYFVESYLTPGMFSAQFHLKAVKPSLPNWARKDAWIADTTQYAVDIASGQERLNRHGGPEIQERIRRGQEHMARYQGEQIFSRTLEPGDGL